MEVRFGDELLIFDLGSGARALGRALEAAPVRASIFLSHYHHDHLQGLPFFTPLYEPANAFTVYGPSREGRGIRSILEAQMKPPYFPVTAKAAFKARVAYREFKAGQVLRLGGGTVAALELSHPGGNLGYRIDHRGRSVVYATDIEHGSALDERFFRFARGADLLIYDAMYTEDEYADRVGWGHSTWQAAVNAADRSEARTLVLFHHDPMRDDAGVERVLRAVRRHRPEAIAARESMVLRA